MKKLVLIKKRFKGLESVTADNSYKPKTNIENAVFIGSLLSILILLTLTLIII